MQAHKIYEELCSQCQRDSHDPGNARKSFEGFVTLRRYRVGLAMMKARFDLSTDWLTVEASDGDRRAKKNYYIVGRIILKKRNGQVMRYDLEGGLFFKVTSWNDRPGYLEELFSAGGTPLISQLSRLAQEFEDEKAVARAEAQNSISDELDLWNERITRVKAAIARDDAAAAVAILREPSPFQNQTVKPMPIYKKRSRFDVDLE